VLLPRDIPLDLTIQTGLGDSTIDLTDLNVRSLTLTQSNTPVQVFLPADSQIAITVQGTYGNITFNAPDDAAHLTISSFTIQDTLGIVTVHLPAAVAYTINANSPFGEIDFSVPKDFPVRLDTASAQVMVMTQNPDVQSAEALVWQSANYDQSHDVRAEIHILSTSGTIKILP
jgi:predicted membrane protein